MTDEPPARPPPPTPLASEDPGTEIHEGGGDRNRELRKHHQEDERDDLEHEQSGDEGRRVALTTNRLRICIEVLTGEEDRVLLERPFAVVEVLLIDHHRI